MVVGLASFGVNRFLARTQQRVLSESIAIIERTERVAQEAELAASLAGRLRDAESAAVMAEISSGLADRVGGIEADLDAMRRFLAQAAGAGSATAVGDLVTAMGRAVDRRIRAGEALRAGRDRLAASGARLAAMISTEADLARLRITAGIWELYALPGGRDPRPGLDRLADVNFFAYERLAEMAEAVATLDRLAARIPVAKDAAELQRLGADYAAALVLARDRAGFMLSRAATDQARAELNVLAQGGALLAQRLAGLAAETELDSLALQLGRELDLLTSEAQRGRDETRVRMKAGVADAGWQATMLLAALAGVILLALLAAYLVWARTRRKVVLRLEEVAERMILVADGSVGQPMAISGEDEIGRLEQALNVLRDRTEEAAELRDRLEAAVIDRTADVVAEMQSANAARADAEELSRAKTHFLARMSHEIRTPLNGMIGLLDLLAGEEADPARRGRLEAALTSARDLQRLTEDILAFSAGEEGQGGQGSEAFDPTALARGLGELLEVMAATRGLAAVVEIAAGLPPAVTGEATKIRQIMMNLLTNAVKYTEGGRVELRVSSRPVAEGHEISLAVRDTGPGMTAEETRQAFDIYGRSMTARRSGVRGVGLGLAITRQLTDAMGAELRVSTAPGRGSVFTLVLCLPEADPAQVAPPAALALTGEGRRVLVVDDHPVNRLVARGYLERMGCSVTEAATGKAALEAVREGRFEAILVDLGLPDMTGEEVLARLGRTGAKVAVLTADLVRDDAATRAKFGVDRVLTKPISPRALASFLAEAEAPAPVAGQGGSGPEAALREDITSLGAAQTAEIVAAMLAELAAAAAQLRAEPDAEARARLAHRLKGAAANFHLLDFCALMQRLQSRDVGAMPALEATAEAAIRDLTAAARRVGLALQPGSGAAKQ